MPLKVKQNGAECYYREMVAINKEANSELCVKRIFTIKERCYLYNVQIVPQRGKCTVIEERC